MSSTQTTFLWLAVACALLCASACEPIAGIPARARESASSLGAAGTPAGSPCSQYCEQANAGCTGKYAVYHGSEDCSAVCDLLSDEDLMCRAQEASTAATTGDAYLHCPGASLGGSAACGSSCATYCRLMSKVCTGSNRDPMEVEDCEAKCAALIDRESLALAATQSRFSVDGDHEGDTLQCRLVHLAIAAFDSADEHCWHAALAPRPRDRGADIPPSPNPCATGLGVTEPRCDDYCHIVMSACTGNAQVYETPAQCQAVCQELDKGSVATNAPETVACRKIHAYNAVMYAQPALHCPHAGPGGDVTCGDDCTGYCTLLGAGCSQPFAQQFGTGPDAMMRCTSECATRHGSNPVHYSVGSAKAKSSNPIACGLLNAARALEARSLKHSDQVASYCAAALGGGECQR